MTEPTVVVPPAPVPGRHRPNCLGTGHSGRGEVAARAEGLLAGWRPRLSAVPTRAGGGEHHEQEPSAGR